MIRSGGRYEVPRETSYHPSRLLRTGCLITRLVCLGSTCLLVLVGRSQGSLHSNDYSAPIIDQCVVAEIRVRRPLVSMKDVTSPKNHQILRLILMQPEISESSTNLQCLLKLSASSGFIVVSFALTALFHNQVKSDARKALKTE